MTGQHFVDRKPQPQECPRCHRIYLEGIDEGIPYRVDVMPLTVPAEIQALKSGRRTYAINGDYICHRDAIRIRGDARRGRPAVLATHDCHQIVQPECYETSAISEVQRLLRIKAVGEMPRNEADGIFAISEGLNGVIISSTAAPF